MKMEVDIGEVLPETKEYLELPEARRGKKELFPHRFPKEQVSQIP